MGETRAGPLAREQHDRSPLYGRERVLEQLLGVLARARESDGGVALVDAPAGLGKSALVDEAIAAARAHDFLPLRADGHELETPLAFGVARQLFEGLHWDGMEHLVAGDAAELEVTHAFYRQVVDLGRECPLLLAVDDLHWADAPSLRFLLYLSERISSLPVAIVMTRRPAEAGGQDDLLARIAANESTTIVRPAPLSAAASAQLIRSRLPRADDGFCEACSETAAGNPLLLVELTRAAQADSVAPTAAARGWIHELAPEPIVSALSIRLGRLPPEARRFAEAVAVLGDDARRWHAARLADLTAGEAATVADALAAVDLLTEHERLRFVHPLHRSALYASIGHARRARSHRDAATLLAEAGAPAERIAAHLLLADPASDAWVVERLRAAAQEALTRGVADSAIVYLRRALDEPAPADVAPQLLLQLGEAEAITGDPGALARLEVAASALADPDERADALLTLGDHLFRAGRYADAGRAFELGLAAEPADADLNARLEAGLGAMQSLQHQDPVSGDGGDSDIDASSAAGRAILSQLATARVMAVMPHEYALAAAHRALDGGELARDDSARLHFLMAASALVWCDDFDAVEEQIEMAAAHSRARAAQLAVADVLYGRCWVNYWRGKLAAAASDGRYCVDTWSGGWHGQTVGARHWLAITLIELGRTAEAAGVLDAADGDAAPGEAPTGPLLAAARGRLALATGDTEAAWRYMSEVDRSARGIPFLHNPAVLPWRSDAAAAALRAGRHEDALRLANEELELARRFGAPRALGVALRAAGMATADGDQIELLQQSVAALESSPAELDLARSLVELGSALRRNHRPRDARDPLRRALALPVTREAVPLQDRARSELAAAGGRPRRDALEGPGALTPTERRVAELAAAGRTNPEIAVELYVTRKTVESHLAGAYRKLGITSRTDLPAMLEAE